MADFKIKTAGMCIEINSLYDNIYRQCAEYITNEDPEIFVNITQADIDFERSKEINNDAQDVQKPSTDLKKSVFLSEEQVRSPADRARKYSDGYLETLAVYRKIAVAALDHDTFLMHGSAIAVDNEAYCFIAASRTGKSTHSRLWRELFGSRAVMINDDKPLVKILPDRALVYGTPWNGKHRLSTNTSTRLKAVIILERGEENHIEKISFRDAYPKLLQQIYRPMNDPHSYLKTLSLIDELADKVQMYLLKCNMSPEAARVSYMGMNPGLKI